MPRRSKKYCIYPGCPGYALPGKDYCAKHVPERKRSVDSRPSPSKRGYGRQWRKIRERVLREYGIPKEHWHLYDVDHEPPYDPDVEPDHTRYTLTPRLHAEHSRKTAKYDGGFGNTKRMSFDEFSGKYDRKT